MDFEQRVPKKTREFRKFFVWLCFKHVLSLLVLSKLKTQISEIKNKNSLSKRFEVAFYTILNSYFKIND